MRKDEENRQAKVFVHEGKICSQCKVTPIRGTLFMRKSVQNGAAASGET
jgi:hypothetical protein